MADPVDGCAVRAQLPELPQIAPGAMEGVEEASAPGQEGQSSQIMNKLEQHDKKLEQIMQLVRVAPAEELAERLSCSFFAAGCADGACGAPAWEVPRPTESTPK
jgi:hypothetical protein